MFPDYDDEANVITRMVRRKFAFAREVAEYEELVEGPGQEPLNSVFYKDFDDQCRPDPHTVHYPTPCTSPRCAADSPCAVCGTGTGRTATASATVGRTRAASGSRRRSRTAPSPTRAGTDQYFSRLLTPSHTFYRVLHRYTYFSRSGLKVVPKKRQVRAHLRQMIFFDGKATPKPGPKP